MNFIEVLKGLSEGKKIRRANNYWRWTHLAKTTSWDTDYIGWFQTNAEVDGSTWAYQWNPKIEDLLAEDWEVLVD